MLLWRSIWHFFGRWLWIVWFIFFIVFCKPKSYRTMAGWFPCLFPLLPAMLYLWRISQDSYFPLQWTCNTCLHYNLPLIKFANLHTNNPITCWDVVCRKIVNGLCWSQVPFVIFLRNLASSSSSSKWTILQTSQFRCFLIVLLAILHPSYCSLCVNAQVTGLQPWQILLLVFGTLIIEPSMSMGSISKKRQCIR